MGVLRKYKRKRDQLAYDFHKQVRLFNAPPDTPVYKKLLRSFDDKWLDFCRVQAAPKPNEDAFIKYIELCR